MPFEKVLYHDGEQESVTEAATSITADRTDATNSVIGLINEQCTDEDGNIYNHLDDVPSSDPCKLCQCTNGVVVCAQEECMINTTRTRTTMSMKP